MILNLSILCLKVSGPSVVFIEYSEFRDGSITLINNRKGNIAHANSTACLLINLKFVNLFVINDSPRVVTSNRTNVSIDIHVS